MFAFDEMRLVTFEVDSQWCVCLSVYTFTQKLKELEFSNFQGWFGIYMARTLLFLDIVGPTVPGPPIQALLLYVNISKSKDLITMKLGMGVLLGGLVKLPDLEKVWVPASAFNLSAFEAISQNLST